MKIFPCQNDQTFENHRKAYGTWRLWMQPRQAVEKGVPNVGAHLQGYLRWSLNEDKARKRCTALSQIVYLTDFLGWNESTVYRSSYVTKRMMTYHNFPRRGILAVLLSGTKSRQCWLKFGISFSIRLDWDKKYSWFVPIAKWRNTNNYKERERSLNKLTVLVLPPTSPGLVL